VRAPMRWNNGAAQATDTGNFKLRGRPLSFDKSREYCTLEVMVCVWMMAELSSFTPAPK
jgi:hypothetical protein